MTNFRQKLRNEIRAVALTVLFFGIWFGVMLVIKQLTLAEYQIEFHRFSLALVGALVVAKVVLVMEHVSLGAWIRNLPALFDVVLRTVLYTLGVLVVLLLEKAFNARHDYDSFALSLIRVFQHEEIHLVWANLICVSSALLVFNMFSVVRRRLGNQELIRLFLSSPSADSHLQPPETMANKL
ncbi:MAG: hypothetical protein ACRESK_08975 [Gammaproteobacteria bacterium]